MTTGSVVDVASSFVGDDLKQYKGVCRLAYPVHRGQVEDWKDMGTLYDFVFKSLGASTDQHPLLLTEAPLSSRRNRAKTAEVLFESYNTPAVFMQIQPILALYASGRTSGLVLDCGDGLMSAVPVYEGFALPHAIQRSDIGGRDVTEYLQTLLRRSGYPLHTTTERDVVRRAKEALCYLAVDAAEEDKLYQAAEAAALAQSGFAAAKAGLASSSISSSSAASASASASAGAAGTGPAEYTLPDGSVLRIGSERFRAAEVLFSPSLIGSEYLGAAELVSTAAGKCDLELRAALYNDIVLAGGATLTAKFGAKLLRETRKLIPKEAKLRIWAPQERMTSAWVGGSILAALSTFSKMWVSRQQYREEGESALFRRSG